MEAESLTAFLQRTRLLLGIPAEVIEKYILPLGVIEEYRKGDELIHAHQRVDAVKMLLTGRVNILYYYGDGSYSLASTESPTRVLALDLIATESKVSPYFAVAAEPASVFSFPSRVLLQPGALPESERQLIMEHLLIMLSNLHIQKEKHLMVLSRNGLRERIITYLSLQAQWAKSRSFDIPFTREEMAAYLCVNRSALSHELSLMRQEGLIEFSKNHFALLQYSDAYRSFEG